MGSGKSRKGLWRRYKGGGYKRVLSNGDALYVTRGSIPRFWQIERINKYGDLIYVATGFSAEDCMKEADKRWPIEKR